MLANDLRRLAEEIAGAYEERMRSISALKTETSEKLANFRTNLEESNRARSESVQAELKDMGDNLRSELDNFTTGLARFKSDLDAAEKNRKDDAQAEISDRRGYIADLKNATINLLSDFENARNEMWTGLKSQLVNFTSELAGFRKEMSQASKERLESIRSELKMMGDDLRSELAGFMSMLNQFKTDLDQAEITRKEEAQAEIGNRKQELQGILGGTRNLLKAYGTAREQMWAELKSRLDAFTSELSQFKADLDRAENERQEEMGREISERREHIENLKGDTRNLISDFENARKQMWRSLKSELDGFTSMLAQFKTDLDRAENERQETVGGELKERAEELRATLSNFSSDLSASVADMLGELKKDRSEAAEAWNTILSAMRSGGGMTLTTPDEPVTPAEPEPETPAEAVEKTKEEPARQMEDIMETEEQVQPEAAEEQAAEEQAPEPDSEAPAEQRNTEIDTQTLHEEIISLLQDSPDGLRMVEVAEQLRIENWRSLIPIMRELLDDGELKKEESTYFVV